jgi:hypothetical protein
MSLLNLPAVNDLGASLADPGLVTETQYLDFCLSLTYTHCWELKSVGMLWLWSMAHMLLLKVPEHVYDCCCHSNPSSISLVFVVSLFLRAGFPLFHAC